MGKEHLSYCKATCALLRGLCWLLHWDPWCYGLISFLNLQGKRGQAQELWQALTDTLQPEMCWLHRNFPKTAGSFISITCANASGNSEGASRTLGLWALLGWGLSSPAAALLGPMQLGDGAASAQHCRLPLEWAPRKSQHSPWSICQAGFHPAMASGCRGGSSRNCRCAYLIIILHYVSVDFNQGHFLIKFIFMFLKQKTALVRWFSFFEKSNGKANEVPTFRPHLRFLS